MQLRDRWVWLGKGSTRRHDSLDNDTPYVRQGPLRPARPAAQDHSLARLVRVGAWGQGCGERGHIMGGAESWTDKGEGMLARVPHRACLKKRVCLSLIIRSSLPLDPCVLDQYVSINLLESNSSISIADFHSYV